MLIKTLQAFLRSRKLPTTNDLDVDSPDTVALHQRIINQNPLLQEVYRVWYQEFSPAVAATASLQPLPMIELGCGASHLDKYIPDVVKTDCVAHVNTDAVVDAQALPYADNSLRAVFMTAVLHHLPDPEKCLREVERCLAPGGRLVLVESSNSILQKFLITRFSPYEFHNDRVTEWTSAPTGRLSSANTALGWVILIRDREIFAKKFPRLRLVRIHYHTLLTYSLSGGMSFRPFLPGSFRPLVRGLEFATRPLHPWLGTGVTVDFEKTQH
ncbi:MAG: class I SAM-dependent methyltransferase [Opitutales bacterium]